MEVKEYIETIADWQNWKKFLMGHSKEELAELIISRMSRDSSYWWNTRGRFYCALFWLKNTEESVWKRFCWWLQFPAFVCFQSVAPVSAQQNTRGRFYCALCQLKNSQESLMSNRLHIFHPKDSCDNTFIRLINGGIF